MALGCHGGRRHAGAGARGARRPLGPCRARPGGRRPLRHEHRVRLALAAGVEAGIRRRGAAEAAGVASRLDRGPASRRRALASALDLRHRDAGVLRHDLGAGAVSGRGVRTRRANDRADLHVHRRAVAGDAKPAAGADRGPAGRGDDHAARHPAARARPRALSPANHVVGAGRRHPTCADRDGAALSIHHLPHVPLLRSPRAGHRHGRCPDLCRPGAGGGAAARHRGVSAAGTWLAVLPGRRLRGRGRRAGLSDETPVPECLRRAGGGGGRSAMSVEERLERLERRIAALEIVVRGLAGQGAAAATRPTATDPPDAPSVATPVGAPPQPPTAAPPPPVRAHAPSAPPPHPEAPFQSPLTEQWIGQRGLLAVGVFALLMATGYLLKLSFDRGWIPPVMRCIGGIVLGIAVGGIGWRLQSRYRTYGAALIGCGAGIVYLSVWAACRLYQVVPPSPGVVGLALVSIALAMVAYAINVEALGATAALGAFLAPALLGREQANANLLLLYLASMATGLGLVAARCRWRLAMLVIAASYFGVAFGGAADHADPLALLVFGLVGGAAGLFVGLRERWGEIRLLSFTGGWALLGEASQHLDRHWPVLAAGIVLSLPVWWHGLRRPRILPLRMAASGEGGWSLGEALYFFTTPILLGWAAYGLAPERLDRDTGLLPLLIGLPYVIAGYQRIRPPFALVGAAAMGLAAGTEWEGTRQVWALLALALVWPALDHRSGRDDGRWYGVATLAAGLQQLFDVAGPAPGAGGKGVVGPRGPRAWGGGGAPPGP